MRKATELLSAILILLLAACPAKAQYKTGAYADLDDSETVTSMKSHVAMISSSMMEGRAAGSEGERLTAEYLTETLTKYGVDVFSGHDGDKFGIRQENGDTLTSRNVCAFIQGYDKSLKDKFIVIGARMDNLGTGTLTIDGRPVERIYYGANGNASGLAMMLELARMLQTNKAILRRSVILLGFGSSRQSFAGAWYFLNREFSGVKDIDAMINLDMVGTGTDGFYAYTSSNADMNAVAEALSRDLQPIIPTVTSQQPYPSDHMAFYSKEIPSVMFTSGQYPQHDTDKDTQGILDFDTMERELEYVYNYTVALANGPKPIFNPSEIVASNSGNGAVPYYDCDYRPTFLGSADPRIFLEKWVYTYMKYPQEAVRNGIQGRVLVDFIIDENGKVKDVKVLKGSDPLLDDEAVRIVSASPSWKPGRLRGKKVKAEMSLYIEFRLEKKGK